MNPVQIENGGDRRDDEGQEAAPLRHPVYRLRIHKTELFYWAEKPFFLPAVNENSHIIGSAKSTITCLILAYELQESGMRIFQRRYPFFTAKCIHQLRRAMEAAYRLNTSAYNDRHLPLRKALTLASMENKIGLVGKITHLSNMVVTLHSELYIFGKRCLLSKGLARSGYNFVILSMIGRSVLIIFNPGQVIIIDPHEHYDAGVLICVNSVKRLQKLIRHYLRTVGQGNAWETESYDLAALKFLT